MAPGLLHADIAGYDQGEDPGLADPAGDQLGVLGAQIDHQHRPVVGCPAARRDRLQEPIPTRWLRWRAFPSVRTDGATTNSAL